MLDGSQNASVQAEIIWLYMINVGLALVHIGNALSLTQRARPVRYFGPLF